MEFLLRAESGGGEHEDLGNHPAAVSVKVSAGERLNPALTFQMSLVPLQLGGQQAPQGPQAAERSHHGVFVVHVGVVVALPAAQTAAGTRQLSRGPSSCFVTNMIYISAVMTRSVETNLPLDLTAVGNGVML